MATAVVARMDTSGDGRASITLPSALRPARVSIIDKGGSNSYQMKENKNNSKDDKDNTFSSAEAFDTVSPDGSPTKLHSSPLSATKRLYSSLNSQDARASLKPGSSASYGMGAVGEQDRSTKTSPSRRSGALPSILPNSAFLTPRKPSHSTPYSKTNNATSITPTSAVDSIGIASSNGSTGGDHSASPVTTSSLAKQQLQPSLFLVDTTRALDATANREPSLLASADATIRTDGHATTSYDDGSNTSTVRSSFNSARARSESRQDTLRSKTSKEPLIAGKAMSASDGARSRETGQNRRKNSKTGSITGFLGLRGESASSSSSRAREASASSLNEPMPTVNEASEKMDASPSRSRSSKRLLSRPEQMNGYQPPYQGGSPHTVVPIISSKTNKPMRNYQIYRELQRQHKQGAKSGQHGSVEKTANPALAYGSTDYGGNNRFLFAGRMVTSGDAPYPFIASFILSLVLPGAFFAFEAQWLWDSSPSGIDTPGGKAILTLFLYSALIMWTSLLRTALRDPGIIVKGLDKEPDWESIAVPVGGEDDLTGTGMGQRPKLRHFKVRDEWVSSKCEHTQSLAR